MVPVCQPVHISVFMSSSGWGGGLPAHCPVRLGRGC